MPINNRDDEKEDATGGGIDGSIMLPDLKMTNHAS